MASFVSNLIFFALAVYAVVDAQDGATNVREKKHAYVAAAPAPVLAYSAPGYYPYNYPTAAAAVYPGAPVPYAAYTAKAYAAYPAKAYAAYPAAAYAPYLAKSYAAYPAATYAPYPAKSYAAPGVYADDDGSFWPGKYEKTAPYAYHY